MIYNTSSRDELIHELEKSNSKIRELESLLESLQTSLAQPEVLNQYNRNQEEAPKDNLIAQKDFFPRLLDSIQDGIHVGDADFNTLLVNKTMERWYGHAAPLVGKKCYENYHGKKEPCTICPAQETLATSKPAYRVVPLVSDLAEQTGWLDLYSFPIFDPNSGKVAGVIEFVRDITARKKAEEVLEKKLFEMNAFINNLPDMAWLKDVNSNFIAANTAFGNAVGMAPEYLVNNTCEVCFGKEAAQKFKDDDKKVMEAREQVVFEESIIDAKGNQVWLETIKSPMFDGSGKVAGTVGIARNITARKEVEEELKRTRDDLESKVQERTADLIEMNEKLMIEITQRKKVEAELRQSERLLSVALEGANLGIWDWNLEAGRAVWTERTQNMLGYKPSEIEPNMKTWKRLIHPEDWPRVSECLNLHLNGVESLFDVEHRMLNKKGEWQWVQAIGRVVEHNPDGVPLRMSGVMADITQRKKTEQALRESEERYRTLVENLNEGIFVIKEGKIEFINPRSLDFTGYSETELTSASFLNFVHPEDRNMVIERHAQRMRGDLSPYQYPVRVLTREGETKCLLVQSRVIPWQGDIATLISATDITQLKAAEKALRESETQLRTLVQAVPGVVYLKDGDGRWLQANEEGLGIFELQDFDYKGKSEPELAEHAVKYREALLTCKETDERAWLERKPVRADEIIPTPDGSERVFDIAKVPLFHPDGRRNGIVVVGLDVTARKKAEDALREQFEIQRALLSTIPAYVFFKDRDLRFITANKHLSDLTGIPEHEFLGKTDYDILPKDNADLCRKSDLQVIETGTPLMNQEEILTDPDDKKMWLSTTKAPFYDSEGKIAGLVGISIDVTDRKRSDELLLQAERFRAVADLAAGVAHNFNNLLQIVIGNLELALMDLDMGDHINVRDEIRRVLESSRFGAETVRRLQSFAGIRDHTQISEKGAFDLSQITDQAIEMCKTWWKTIPEKSGIKITLNRELQDNCSVLCEKNEIFDVVVNLIKNAVEAMPEGGTINVLTGVQGDWVSLKISDTGIGISETNRKRIFNPFFTTKAFAGSGLGLASSRKIVQEYGGTILVDSTEGKGTTFTVLIPLAREERKDRGNSQLPIIPQNLKILAIDDEQPVLDLLKNALRRTNCELFTANSGAEGLELWNSGSFDLVICDLGMPGMNGWDVAKQIKCLSNDRKIAKTPFILLTGWGGQKTETEKIAENGVDVVLEKPLNIMAMFEIVREVVERCRN